MADVTDAEHIFRMLNRPLWIVTASDGHRQGGLVATWVTQASLSPDRPVVCAGLAPNHFTSQLVLASRRFAVHLLRKDQAHVAFPFCLSSGREHDKIAACRAQGIQFREGSTQAPLLVDCLAVMECEIYAQLNTGDRIYFWADVVNAHRLAMPPLTDSVEKNCVATEPLCEQDFFQAATNEQLSALKKDMQSDIEQQVPWHESWRQSLPEVCRLPLST